MIFYIIPIIIGFLLSFNKSNDNFTGRKSIKNLFVLLCAILFCGGYMTGSDWHVYEMMYDEARWNDLKFVQREHGFYILMLMFKKIGFGFFPFMILCRFLVFYIVKGFISNYSNNFYFSFSVFLASNALFLFVDNPLRFMIAFGIIVLSLRYLLERKFILYFLFISIAFTFHISSFIMIFVYFIPYKTFNNKFIQIFLYLFLFIILNPSMLGGFIQDNITLFSFYTEYYLETNPDEHINILSIGRFINALLFIFIVINKDKIINFFEKGEQLYLYTITYFYLSLFAIIPTFFRLSLFLVPFFYISIPMILFSKTQNISLVKIVVIAYFLISPIRQIYSTFTYIPYSNFFVSLFEPEKSYYERVNYNKNKYYERTGKWPEK